MNGVLRLSTALVGVLRFAIHGKHPKRRVILTAYLALRLRMAIFRRTRQSFSLLGTEIHFDNAKTIGFLFRELFIDEVYGGCEQAPATIIDCGSNIGMSILLFKSLWPECKITGIEASPETFALLKQNVKELPGVTVLHKAVSDHDAVISFFSGENSLLASTNALRGGVREIPMDAVRLSDLIAGSVDLMKIDIEGSESAVFAELEASGKLPLIRQMFIEYHHRLPGETGGLASFLARLERCGFDYELASSLPRRSGDFQDVLIRAKRHG